MGLAPVVLVVMNIVFAGSAYPLGALSDRFNRRQLLAIGFATLVAADLVLAWAPNLWVVMGGVALWGLYLGATQGLLSALVADAAPVNLRASAFGAFNFASGMALLLASLLAGLLWTRIGPSATFIAGAAFTVLGLSLLPLLPTSSAAPRAEVRPIVP